MFGRQFSITSQGSYRLWGTACLLCSRCLTYISSGVELYTHFLMRLDGLMLN
jgi:hypothetical protein